MTKTRKRRSVKLDQALDLMTDEELPEYQANLAKLVVMIQEDPELAKLTDGLGIASIKLAYSCTDPRVKRTVSDMCRAAGVDRSTYYACRSNPKWNEFKNKLARRHTDGFLDEAMVSLMHLVKMHDAKGLRLFFELRGDLVQRVESTTVQETHEERMRRLKEKARGMTGTTTSESHKGG